jgi:UDP-glucose 4-epimerase
VKVLVTGGAGFIGRNLVPALRRRGDRVLVLDDLSAGSAPPADAVVLPPGGGGWDAAVGFVRADARDLAAVRRACRGADGVVHLAASTGIPDSLARPLEHCENNATGTLVVLEACRQEGVSRCVVASSGAAVGDAPPPVHEGAPPAPVSPYGASKLAGEAYCRAYRASFGLAAHALRFSNVYGPHSDRKTSVVATFVAAVLEGRPLVVFGDGTQTRDFVFVEDLVEGIRAALLTGAPHPVYQLGSGVETSVEALVALLGDVAERHLGARPRVERRPARAGEVRRSVADVSLARRALGWTPATPLADGLARTFAWFLARRRAGGGA